MIIDKKRHTQREREREKEEKYIICRERGRHEVKNKNEKHI